MNTCNRAIKHQVMSGPYVGPLERANECSDKSLSVQEADASNADECNTNTCVS